MPTLIKSIFYPEVGSVALFFVQAPKLLFINCTKNVNSFAFIGHLGNIEEG